MSSQRRTIIRRIKRRLTGRYPWGNTGNRASRRRKVKSDD